MNKQYFDPAHPVAAAVEPLRAEAMERAAKFAADSVARVEAALAAAGGDMAVCAPRPRTNISRADYQKAMGYCVLVGSLTRSTMSHCRRPGDPDPVVMCPELTANFVESARKDASVQYDEFIFKMISKIGACDAATLAGSHVWGFSMLTVTKGADVERWKTQMILNVSVLGKLFNQFPSRKVK